MSAVTLINTKLHLIKHILSISAYKQRHPTLKKLAVGCNFIHDEIKTTIAQISSSSVKEWKKKRKKPPWCSIIITMRNYWRFNSLPDFLLLLLAWIIKLSPRLHLIGGGSSLLYSSPSKVDARRRFFIIHTNIRFPRINHRAPFFSVHGVIDFTAGLQKFS